MTRQTNQPDSETTMSLQNAPEDTNDSTFEVQVDRPNGTPSRSPSEENNKIKLEDRSRNQSFCIRNMPVSRSQMKEFKEAFRLFDKDGDGTITKEELGRVMRSLGQFARTEELQQMLQEIDADGDGNVSFEEFVDIAWSASSGNDPNHTLSLEEEEKELRDAFRVFDKHNRGYISASDLRAVLHCLGEDLSEEEIEDMIKEVDVDGDGRIDFYEFVNALGEPGTEDSYDEDDDDYLAYYN